MGVENAISEKKQPVYARNRILFQIFRIAEPLAHFRAGIECVVHFRHKIRGNKVVRVEYEISLVVGVFFEQPFKPVPQGVTLSLSGGIVVVQYEYGRACLFGNFPRTVGAVVRHDENIQQFLRVVLLFQAFDQIADDRFFIPRRDQYGVFVLYFRLLIFFRRNEYK